MITSGTSYTIPPGHDARVVGNTPLVGIEVMSTEKYPLRRAREGSSRTTANKGRFPSGAVTVHWRLISALSCVVLIAGSSRATAQVVHAAGQNIAPVYEGWERNPDGSLAMVFGYFNRNLEEEPFVPIGPNNTFEPGEIDRGQPTHFYPRRQQFMFKVPIPKDWGSRELVWTLTVHGRTEKAYGSLLPVWQISQQAYEQNRSTTLLHAKDDPINQPPSISLLSAARATVTLPETLALRVSVADDGLPPSRPRLRSADGTGVARQPISPMSQAVVRLDQSWRLGVIWIHHRGPGTVTFDPMRQPIGDGRAGEAATTAHFSEPGAYVLRAYADDGILISSVDVTVIVNPRR